MSIGVHGVSAATWSEVLDVAESKWPSSVLIALELGNGCLGSSRAIKANNTSSTGATARLILDFGLFDLADRREELDQIFVASGPWKLLK